MFRIGNLKFNFFVTLLAVSCGLATCADASSIVAAAAAAAATTTPVTRTLYVFPEADSSVTPLYALVNGAQKTIDMTMYELVDTKFSADLVAACGRGVKVRVILGVSEKTNNTPAYTQLNAAPNCAAAWSNPQFTNTHEKSFVVDGTQLSVMSLNLASIDYKTTRDFALVENDPADIAAVEATFNADYKSTTSFSYKPGAGDSDLIWSPTTATADLVGIITGAKKTLLVENEEMVATNIVTALEAACKRGVAVNITLTDSTTDETNYKALEAAGCGVHTYPNNASALYIHAKVLVADYGLSTQSIYMGSINFSTTSMTKNRELGIYISDPTAAKTLNATLTADYQGAAVFSLRKPPAKKTTPQSH